jgi:hypothetical protein
MTTQIDKAIGNAAAVASIAAAVVATAASSPVIAAVAMGAGTAVAGAALYHKLSSESSGTTATRPSGNESSR